MSTIEKYRLVIVTVLRTLPIIRLTLVNVCNREVLTRYCDSSAHTAHYSSDTRQYL